MADRHGTPPAGRADAVAESCEPAGLAEFSEPPAVCRRRAGRRIGSGIGLALWLELRDKSIRTEQDVRAALDLPMLVSVPWVGAGAAGKRASTASSRIVHGSQPREKETVEV